MPVEGDLAAVVDIVDAAKQARRFVEGLDAERFRKDAKTSAAVILQLLIIGEAAKRLSGGFHAEHPQLPWSEIIAHARSADPSLPPDRPAAGVADGPSGPSRVARCPRTDRESRG